MRLITKDDLIETYCKIHQRGLEFITSKLNWSKTKRTQSAFDNSSIHSSNWWMIPKVRRRWNRLITGDENLLYEDYVINKYLENKKGQKMLSLGSGVCSHELHFANSTIFEEVKCVDFADNLLEKAKQKATDLGLVNMIFVAEDITKMVLEKEYYDIVLFHSSLHHFANIKSLLENKVLPSLKKQGLLIIHEFVGPNRLQYPKVQIQKINEALDILPVKYKKRLKVNITKYHTSGPGWLRMYIADPSECVESESIVPILHSLMDIKEEKPFGGNILMPLLKDISHHFVVDDAHTNELLDRLFEYEDEYLKNFPSDFLFGIYMKK